MTAMRAKLQVGSVIQNQDPDGNLNAINDENPGAIENPYPNSKDPSNTKIDPTADGLKL